ncbi:MAG: hypothetical protein AAB768_04170 [Patescibacteria group bacterium]
MSASWIEERRRNLDEVIGLQGILKMGSRVGPESQVTAQALETGGYVVDEEFILGETAGLKAAAYMALRRDGVDVDSKRKWKWLRQKKAKTIG